MMARACPRLRLRFPPLLRPNGRVWMYSTTWARPGINKRSYGAQIWALSREHLGRNPRAMGEFLSRAIHDREPGGGRTFVNRCGILGCCWCPFAWGIQMDILE